MGRDLQHGAADYGKADYTNLPAGLYRFRMEALNLMGSQPGQYFPVGDRAVGCLETLWFWVAAVLALFAIAPVAGGYPRGGG